MLARIVAAAALLCCSACTSASSSTGGAPIAAPCASGDDCASHLCVVVAGRGLCSASCVADSDCPSSPWQCMHEASGSACVCVAAPFDTCGNGIDDDCNGGVDDCEVDAACTGCRADQSCVQGACACASADTTDCDGRCVDVQTDSSHCGECGRACPGGTACIHGACSCAASGATWCASSGCVEIDRDPLNCGACDLACPETLTCEAGVCGCHNPNAPTWCAGSGCTDLSRDPAHCAACDRACPAGQVCDSGLCSCPGEAPDICAEGCVDVATDSHNCGACGVACSSGAACLEGSCVCQPDATWCSGACVDLQADAQHCSACGESCKPGESCVAGVCSCVSGLVCVGACTPADDPANCGACGVACGSGQACQQGSCVCPASEAWCGAKCVALQSDPAHCGVCGNACPAGQSCHGGLCACGAGLRWCASVSACVDVTADPANCGACGQACPSGSTCELGACQCPAAGQVVCPSSGLCEDLANSKHHCGSCEHACAGQTQCENGICVCDDPALSLCAAACVNLSVDTDHCGACDNGCPGVAACEAGACHCSAPAPGPIVRLTATQPPTRGPSAAASGQAFAVAYCDQTSDLQAKHQGNILVTLLDGYGAPVGVADRALTAFPEGTDQSAVETPDVIWNGQEWAVAWTELSVNPYHRVRFQRLAPDLTPLGSSVDVSALATSPNTPMLYGGVQSLAYSQTRGYAILSGLAMHLIGPQGDHLDAAVELPCYSEYSYPASLAASTTQFGVLCSQADQARLVVVDHDLANSQTIDVVDGAFVFDAAAPVIAYDGVTWVGAWVKRGNYEHMLVLRRGPLLAQEQIVVAEKATFGSYDGRFTYIKMMRDPVALNVMWAHLDEDDDQALELFLQRFVVPQDPGARLEPLSPPVKWLAEKRVTAGYAFASTGTSLLATWSDTQFDNLELAAVAGPLSCP